MRRRTTRPPTREAFFIDNKKGNTMTPENPLLDLRVKISALDEKLLALLAERRGWLLRWVKPSWLPPPGA
jgi:chorismate mutase/prephenate dehydratase